MPHYGAQAPLYPNQYPLQFLAVASPTHVWSPRASLYLLVALIWALLYSSLVQQPESDLALFLVPASGVYPLAGGGPPLPASST